MDYNSGSFTGGGYGGGAAAAAAEKENLSEKVKEFVRAAMEMSLEFGRGCRDIVRQSVRSENSFVSRSLCEDSFIGRRLKGPFSVIRKLRFFNDYLPEDKDPFYAWSVILLVFLVSLAAISLNTAKSNATTPALTKTVYIHPPSANRVLLPDGRYMAYREQGVPADRARFSVIVPHSFLSSRLSGIPGLKDSLLEEFGVRLVTYDLPGFGESDPHPCRTLKSSALEMSFLANALGLKNDKFWVIGYSTGALHAWAALRYIPEQIAGAAMFSPMVNPYDPAMTREEKHRMWRDWTRKRKFMYFLARRFPRLLAYFYRRSFLSGKHDRIDKWLSLSLGSRDKALIEDPVHQEFWQRDIEESIRQRNANPFVEEAVLQVANWGFSLSDIKLQKKQPGKGIVNLLRHLLRRHWEEFTGFLGPVHIWQGMDDTVVPPATTDFVHRVLPGAAVHKLPYEGHFTYFCFCYECHRQIFTTLFGTPQGPRHNKAEISGIEGESEVNEDVRVPNSTDL